MNKSLTIAKDSNTRNTRPGTCFLLNKNICQIKKKLLCKNPQTYKKLNIFYGVAGFLLQKVNK